MFCYKADAIKYEKELSVGLPVSQCFENTYLTYNDMSKLYLEYCQNNTQFGTYKRRKIIMENHILPLVGDVALTQFSKNTVNKGVLING